MKVNITTQATSTEFPRRVTYDGKIILNPTIEILAAMGWRTSIDYTVPEGFRAININWIQDTEDPYKAIATYDLENIAEKEAEREQAWQDAKSVELKYIENTYIDFLTNDWTPALHTAGLLPEEYSITVSNTDENTNIGLLLQLRSIDRAAYYNMAGEFDRFRNTITRLDGVMGKVKQHMLG